MLLFGFFLSGVVTTFIAYLLVGEPLTVVFALHAFAPVTLLPLALMLPGLWLFTTFGYDAARQAAGSDTHSMKAVLRQAPTWSNIVMLGLIGPLLEEMLFRGVILQGLLAQHPVGLSLSLGGLLFAIAHGVRKLKYRTIVGVLLGVIFLLTGSLWPCIVFHAVLNLGLMLGVAKRLRDFVLQGRETYSRNTSALISASGLALLILACVWLRIIGLA